jgi:hypothetical protein
MNTLSTVVLCMALALVGCVPNQTSKAKTPAAPGKKVCPQTGKLKAAAPTPNTVAAWMPIIDDDVTRTWYAVSVDSPSLSTELGRYLVDVSYANLCVLGALGSASTPYVRGPNGAAVSCYGALRLPTTPGGVAMAATTVKDVNNLVLGLTAGSFTNGAPGVLNNQYKRNWSMAVQLGAYATAPQLLHGPTFPPDPWCCGIGNACGTDCNGDPCCHE